MATKKAVSQHECVMRGEVEDEVGCAIMWWPRGKGFEGCRVGVFLC
jgi:hypothetical protein